MSLTRHLPWLFTAATAAWLATAACGQSECDKATIKADNCGFDRIPDTSSSSSASSSGGQFGAPTPQPLHECGSVAACEAACVNQTTCDALLRNGKDTAGEQSYDTCLRACPPAN